MENAQSAVKVVSSLWEQVIHAPSHLLLLLVLVVLGFFIKKSPTPNWTIPWILMILGIVGYPLLASPSNIDPSFPNPTLVLRLYGFLLGAGSVGVHVWLRRYEWFKKIEMGIVNAFRDEDKKMSPAVDGIPEVNPQKPAPSDPGK